MDKPPITETFHDLIYGFKKKITGKLLEENIGVNPCDFGWGKAFLDMTPKAQITKERVDKSNCIKI